MLRLTPDGTVADISVGVAGIADKPILLPLEAGRFTGALPDGHWRSAVMESAKLLPYIDDLHASAAYRKSVTAHLVGQALAAMLNKAGSPG
jgi:CO/xanthine dehydrogenase FAD-binding subunit